ncbi:MAG: hypothetical protein V1736_07155 [Pseudomonadota bacterium]
MDEMTEFKPNRKFRKDYNRLFKRDPLAANTLLLLCELANDRGEVLLPADPEEQAQQIRDLMAARFEDPRARQI